MNKYRFKLIRLAALLVSVTTLQLGATFEALATDYLAHDIESFQKSVPKLQPGDDLVLANGLWSNVELVFEGRGTKDKPISLRAETAGKVFISGVSNLRLAGEHLIVKGLVFKDGYSPTKEVVSFRKNKNAFGNHIRFTENVIDGFNKPNRQDEDSWIVLHGKNNRVDHNHIVGKTNKGPSLIVRLNAKQSEENNHLIDHNYFGHRPTLGGNGGETMRIGVSQTSRVDSYTKISRNYFEHCDGEVEIISNKSERNTITENVFFESQGSVVFRHGGHNIISRNVFFGNGLPNTGGVRVINNDQQVFDNYFEGLRGQKFNAGLTIMNGVPNSPQNRYHQVDGGIIRNNSFIDVDHIGLGVGSDQERSAVPINTSVTNNLVTSNNDELVGIFDDISGIEFKGNVSDKKNAKSFKSKVVSGLKFKRAENGLLYPTKKLKAGAPADLNPVKRKETGTAWYPKPKRELEQRAPVIVAATASALKEAVVNSSDGDALVLTHGTYNLVEPLVISHRLTIQSANEGQSIVRVENGPAFELLAGADLYIDGLSFEQGNQIFPVIYAPGYRYDGKYSLTLNNVSAKGITKAENGPLLASSSESFADLIDVEGLSVSGWNAPIFMLNAQGLNGWYLADRLQIKNSTFKDVQGPIANYGRDGRDESTFGPSFQLAGSTLENVQQIVQLDGIDGFDYTNNQISNSGDVKVQQRVLGYPFTMNDNTMKNIGKVSVFGRDGDVFDFSDN
jgi:poly(beta-D-mannuronate) lyase